ncbi:hypothetical protein [Pseudarthrobacter sp. NIBRBAC000502771]|uniref:hypothetical protein n=1 Tax=Pseudarthrobacter sp. NIBRBAC000502771 TaxID=2590774 RepID=UPI0011312D1D|nr:hypothetical protein [Pseudarthrobacter sp. NIBRBAC000502771]QDG61255.1 hypothetical protein NIBR502771_02310 [Pseudarthrobacter sp. NIBRBAC000502771]
MMLRRAFLGFVYALFLGWLAIPALNALRTTDFLTDNAVLTQAALLIIIPAVMLLHSVVSNRHSLAWSMFWVWSLIFLGLASTYQISRGQFPWRGTLAVTDIVEAQQLILIAHAVTIAFYFLTAARSKPQEVIQVEAKWDGRHFKRAVISTMVIHVFVVAMFAALMGSSMFAGRATFQSMLLARAGTPGFGSMYFISNAGAIIIPAMAIILRKRGMNLPIPLIGLSVAASFLATNPFIGSRFLTGSFLVAVVGALLTANQRRGLPGGMILAFVTIFPTLDLLRGDGTGATQLAISDPADTLTDFDYDAFEMLTREVSVNGNLPAGLPSTGDLLIAPFFRWIPFLARGVEGHASGPVVAQSTHMTYTNVSMPLWAEAHLIGALPGVIIAFAVLGVLLARTRSTGHSVFGILIELPMAALLFIVLRGSLYEVLGYLLLACALAWAFARAERKDRLEEAESAGPVHVPAGSLRVE